MSGLLLDTHVFLWYASEDPKLPASIRDLIDKEPGTIFVSVASAWELAIKIGLGKLELSIALSELLGTSQEANGIELLSLSEEDVLAYASLGFPVPSHRDPFDRILIVQAQRHHLPLVTADQVLKGYQVDVVSWGF